MHLGILWAEQGSGTQRQVRRLVLGKVLESPPGSGTFIDKDAKYGWYNDAGTIRRWARAVPDPPSTDIFISVISLPSDPDPYFRASLPTWVNTDTSYTISVVRVATGLAVSWSVVGTALSWPSDGGQEEYDINISVVQTKDTSLPSEFDAYQMSSNSVAGANQRWTDPRSGV